VGFDLLLARGRTSMGARLDRWRGKRWQVGQCAISAGVAWWLATDVLHHDRAFFAPVAAVVALGTSYGQRLRRVGEVTVGVAIGVFLGDVFTHYLGTGPWQLALIVALAMSTALLLDAGVIFVTQAAVQSIVVSTLLPDPGAAFTRWSDALVGGAVALVAASVVPRAPLRRPREQAAKVAHKISELLRAAADCMEDGEIEHARAVLADARATEHLIGELKAAASEGLSIVASSPFRVRHRDPVRQMAELIEPLDRALRNTRVLLRRVMVAAYRREPIPPGYAAFARDLARVVDLQADELAAGRMAEAAESPLVEMGVASSSLARTHGLSGEVVLAQFRSIIVDLLAVTGMDPMGATDAIPPLTGS
jgi:uncharacterized membrane protein YgaE (UPF0421/DUF939 family)